MAPLSSPGSAIGSWSARSGQTAGRLANHPRSRAIFALSIPPHAASEMAAIPRGTTWAMRDLNSRPLPCERSDPEPERTPADKDGIDSNDPDDSEPPRT